MTENLSHARLDALAEKIEQAQKSLATKGILHRQKDNIENMITRYKLLKEQLNGEITDMEEHGHHVSALERSFRKWFDGIDLDA